MFRPETTESERLGARPGDGGQIETLCVSVDLPPARTRPLMLPIAPAAVYEVDSLETLQAIFEGRASGYVYGRGASPNQTELETLVARLEGAEAGLACASGPGLIRLSVSIEHPDDIIADLRGGLESVTPSS